MQLALSYLCATAPAEESVASVKQSISAVERAIKAVEKTSCVEALEQLKGTLPLLEKKLAGYSYTSDLPRVRSSSYGDEWGETIVAVRSLCRKLQEEGWDQELSDLARQLAMDVWHAHSRDVFGAYNLNLYGGDYEKVLAYLNAANPEYDGQSPFEAFQAARRSVTDEYSLTPESELMEKVIEDVWARFNIPDAGDPLYDERAGF